MIKESNHNMQSVYKVINAVFTRFDSADQILLVHLWQNWTVVMGHELENLVFPLGHKKTTLNVGGEDSVSLQEISMQRSEILERVNAFMEKDFFTDLKVSLLFGKTPLDIVAAHKNECLAITKINLIPLSTGKYLESMNPDSAVAKCYAKFCSLKNT